LMEPMSSSTDCPPGKIALLALLFCAARMSFANRTLMNSSLLFEKIPKKRRRCIKGTELSSASCKTRRLNASQLSSRLKKFFINNNCCKVSGLVVKPGQVKNKGISSHRENHDSFCHTRVTFMLRTRKKFALFFIGLTRTDGRARKVPLTQTPHNCHFSFIISSHTSLKVEKKADMGTVFCCYCPVPSQAGTALVR